jgi:glycosyltransferase involved in cell wall biosynthesis
MKVLHVELGRHLYGGQRQVAYLMGELPRLGGEHVLVCPEGSDIAMMADALPVPTIPLRISGDIDLGFLGRLRRVIREQAPDLMHIHSRRGDMLATLAGRLEGLKMVYSRRVDNPPNWLDRWYKFPRYTRIITISQGICRVLLDMGLPPERVICAPSAVDVQVYRPQANHDSFRREFGLSMDAPILGVVAQLIQRKGHDVLFDALPSVFRGHPDTQVLIFGQGPLADGLRKQIAERGWSEGVRLMGFHGDMARLLPHLDLLVHPAYMEGLGVALLEAAACGVPIVATKAGGIPEIVQDGINGRLIEPGDAAALAAGINDLLADRSRLRAMGEEGRKLVQWNFSIESMARNNLAVYEAALGLR